MKKIKNKKGITILLFAVMGTAIIAFTALILDVGRAYVYQEKLQGIADASVAGGSISGQKAFIQKWVDKNGKIQESVRSEIIQDIAEEKAKEIFEENCKAMFENFTLQGQPKITFNFEETPKVACNVSKKTLYGAGVMHVHVTGEIKGFITGIPIRLNRTATMVLSTTVNSSKEYKKGSVEIKNGRTLILRNDQGNIILEQDIR